jgi:serine/threonine-protein kinase HipA
MSVNGRFRGITKDDVLAVADRHRVGDARAAIAKVKAALASWPEFAAQAGIDTARSDEIGATFGFAR